MVNYIIDIAYILIAIAILAIFTNKGLIGSVLKFGKTGIALVLAFAFGPMLGEFFYNKWFYNAIYGGVLSKIDSVLDGAVSGIDIKTIFESFPRILRCFINEVNLEKRFNNGVENFSEIADELAVSVSSPLAEILSNFLAYIAIFTVAGLFLVLFGNLIMSLVKKIPVVNKIDKVLGFLFGVLFAFIFLSLATFLLGIIVSLLGGNATFEEIVSGSYLFEFFGKYNIIKTLRF